MYRPFTVFSFHSYYLREDFQYHHQCLYPAPILWEANYSSQNRDAECQKQHKISPFEHFQTSQILLNGIVPRAFIPFTTIIPLKKEKSIEKVSLFSSSQKAFFSRLKAFIGLFPPNMLRNLLTKKVKKLERFLVAIVLEWGITKNKED